jgi:hypothetical protein
MVRIEIRISATDAARWNALPTTDEARRVIALGLDAADAEKVRAAKKVRAVTTVQDLPCTFGVIR